MKRKTQAKPPPDDSGGTPFQRFERLVSNVIRVPRSKIVEKERQHRSQS